MSPDDFLPIERSTPPIYRHDPSFPQREPLENDYLQSLIPQNTSSTYELNPHISQALLPTYHDLELSEHQVGNLLGFVEDKSHLVEHLRFLIDKSEDFINFLIVKQARALNFDRTIELNIYENRVVEMGLQFLRSETLEWQMDFANFLDLSQGASPSATGASGLDFTVAFLNSLGHAGSIFLMGIHLNKAKDVLEFKREALQKITDPFERDKLEKEMQTLRVWIEMNRNIVIRGLKSEAMAMAVSTPKLISAITSIAAGPGTVTSTVFDWVGLGIDLVSSAFRLKKAHSDKKYHAEWAEAFRGTNMTPQMMNSVITKQENAHKMKLDRNLPKLEAATKEVLEEKFDGVEFPIIIDKLKKVGWDLPEEIKTPDEVEAFITIQGNREAANEQMLKNSEGPSASLRQGRSATLRNALRSLADMKANIDKGFVKLRLNRAKALFTSASLLTGLMIALKVAAVAGVVLAASALVFVGYGMLVVTVGAIIVGGIYLKVKKPNLFKEHWKGVKTRLLMRKIPLIIQNFRLQRTTMESSKIATSLLVNNMQKGEIESLIIAISNGEKPEISDDIKNRIKALKKAKGNEKITNILNKALQDLKKKIDAETSKFDSLNKKMDKLRESVDKHDAVARILQDRLTEAGWKDYLWRLNKNHKGYDENIVFDLAEALMSDPELLDDPDTKQLLEYLEINLEQLRNLPNSTENLLDMAHAFASFFGTDDEETITRIRARKMMVKYG